MITLQEAIAIAKKWNDKFNTYQEYKDAYEFYVDDGATYDGGGYSCVIEKESGKVLRWEKYFMDPEREIVQVGKPIRI